MQAAAPHLVAAGPGRGRIVAISSDAGKRGLRLDRRLHRVQVRARGAGRIGRRGARTPWRDGQRGVPGGRAGDGHGPPGARLEGQRHRPERGRGPGRSRAHEPAGPQRDRPRTSPPRRSGSWPTRRRSSRASRSTWTGAHTSASCPGPDSVDGPRRSRRADPAGRGGGDRRALGRPGRGHRCLHARAGRPAGPGRPDHRGGPGRRRPAGERAPRPGRLPGDAAGDAGGRLHAPDRPGCAAGGPGDGERAALRGAAAAAGRGADAGGAAAAGRPVRDRGVRHRPRQPLGAAPVHVRRLGATWPGTRGWWTRDPPAGSHRGSWVRSTQRSPSGRADAQRPVRRSFQK